VTLRKRRLLPKPRTRSAVAAAVVAGTLCAFIVALLIPGAAIAATASAAPGTWYFAEGYTGSGFQEYLCIANPESTTASIDATFMFKGGGSQLKTYSIKPMSRYTVDVNAAVGQDREVSVVLTSLQRDLVVERPIYFNYQGRWPGGHCVFAATAASKTWYFAEGYTGGAFDEYVCVLNPGAAAAGLTFRFQTRSSGEIVKRGSVGASHT